MPRVKRIADPIGIRPDMIVAKGRCETKEIKEITSPPPEPSLSPSARRIFYIDKLRRKRNAKEVDPFEGKPRNTSPVRQWFGTNIDTSLANSSLSTLSITYHHSTGTQQEEEEERMVNRLSHPESTRQLSFDYYEIV